MPEVLNVKCGEILSATEDIKFSRDDKSTIIKTGDKVIVGFDRSLHGLKERIIIKDVEDDDFTISGYSADGLSQFLIAWLDYVFDLDDVLRKSEVTSEDLSDCIRAALVEIGMSSEGGTSDEEIRNKEFE